MFNALCIQLVVVMMCAVLCASAPARAGERQLSLNLWDWTGPCRDVEQFRAWAEDLKGAGFTHVEISAAWRVLEPRPGEYDLSFIEQRWDIAKELGLKMRVRINSFYSDATPRWLEVHRWVDRSGALAVGTPPVPSINDERFWARYGPLCTAIAERFRGEELLYSPFIGVHAELKWSDWWTYDASSMAKWRDAIHARPRALWLERVVGDAALPEFPPVPGATEGVPDVSAESRAFIAFREQCWREAVGRFVEALRAGDPEAQFSAPLGESYRRDSARMSNLDYYGLSRQAAEVVHSYDFYWHPKDPAWHAGAAVASFRGITQLPVSFEYDGPALMRQFNWSAEQLAEIAAAALAEGAGLKLENYSYHAELPSTYPLVQTFARMIAAAPAVSDPPRQETVLLFLSKWANYCYREKTEWLHDAQLGAWRMLRERGWPVRIVCEDNLSEDLSGYRAIYVAFSPPQLMPAADAQRLEELCATMPAVIELPVIPPVGHVDHVDHAELGRIELTAKGLPVGPAGQEILRRRNGKVIVGYPMAYVWLHGDDREAQQRVLQWCFSAAAE